MVQQEKFYMSNQPQLFETEDQYGNDIIQGPKLNKRSKIDNFGKKSSLD